MLERVLIVDADRDGLDLLHLLATTAWPTAVIEELDTDCPMVDGTLPWERYDLALFDYGMGFQRPTGPTWLKDIRSSQRPPITVVIGKKCGNWDAMRAVKNGADDCLVGGKLSARKLKTTVQRVITASGRDIPITTDAPPPPPRGPREEKGHGAPGMGNQQLPASAFLMPGYQIIRRIASGASAQAWLAKSVADGTRLVLKIMPLMEEIEDEALARFMREYEMAGEIEHPNIARIYERAFGSDFAYFAMELLPGGELTQVISEGLRPEVAKGYIAQIARGLDAAHACHVVHCDLKPSNILFREDRTLAIIDFGVAKDVSAGAEVTGKSTVKGTPYYMSPEQIVGDDVDPRADLYSLGVIMFELLTGARPFEAKKLTDLLRAHMSSPIPRLPASAAWAQPVVDRLLAKDREERYPSAKALLADLDRHIPERVCPQ